MDPQHLVSVEIGLLDSSVLQGNLAVKCCRDAKDDRALDLSPNGVGINGDAAIDSADDPVNANLSVLRHLDFSNLRHISRKDELKGDAATETLRLGLSPAGFCSSQFEDCLGAGGLVEQSSPIGDWISLRRCRQLVDEAFGHEDVVRGPDAAPEGGRNARRLYLHILDVQVRKKIDQINCALGGVGVETIPKKGRGPSREDRGTREAMVPGDRHSVRVETS